MSLQRQLKFWLIAVVVLCAMLYVFSPILLPFIMGMAIAYFLDPVADWLERLHFPRIAATSVILGVFALVFIVFLIILVPVLGEQITNFGTKLPDYLKSLVKLFDDVAPDSLKQLLADEAGNYDERLAEYGTELVNWGSALLKSLVSGGLAILNLFSLLIVTPVVAFYMLNDWDRMVAYIDSWLPRDHIEAIRALAREVDTVLAGFIRGQGSVCLVLGIIYAGSLSVVGLNFGMLIGLMSGLISFIPYVGSITGFVVAGGIALVQFLPGGDWISVVIVLSIFVVGQLIEGYVLSPKLVGDRVGLHPVWLMFALFAFGYLFGFVGLLLAVPLAAAAGVLIRFGIKSYMESPVFLGVAGKQDTEEE